MLAGTLGSYKVPISFVKIGFILFLIIEIYLIIYLCYWRPIGCDIKKGSSVLNPFTRIGPVEIGLLAACGYKRVTVTLLPRIGILSTGDELQQPGEPLRPGQIYDSNRISLISLLKENGFDSLDFGIVIDKYVNIYYF